MTALVIAGQKLAPALADRDTHGPFDDEAKPRGVQLALVERRDRMIAALARCARRRSRPPTTRA